MSTRTNFADPEYEPTDDDLAELMHEAFSGLAEAHEQSLREMRARIARAQADQIRQHADLLDPRRRTP